MAGATTEEAMTDIPSPAQDKLAEIEQLWDPEDNSLEAQDVRWLIEEVKRLRDINTRAQSDDR